MTDRRGEPDRRIAVAILAAAFLFNLGQGALRPSLMGAVADAVGLSAPFFLAAALLTLATATWSRSRLRAGGHRREGPS